MDKFLKPAAGGGRAAPGDTTTANLATFLKTSERQKEIRVSAFLMDHLVYDTLDNVFGTVPHPVVHCHATVTVLWADTLL